MVGGGSCCRAAQGGHDEQKPQQGWHILLQWHDHWIYDPFGGLKLNIATQSIRCQVYPSTKRHGIVGPLLQHLLKHLVVPESFGTGHSTRQCDDIPILPLALVDVFVCHHLFQWGHDKTQRSSFVLQSLSSLCSWNLSFCHFSPGNHKSIQTLPERVVMFEAITLIVLASAMVYYNPCTKII